MKLLKDKKGVALFYCLLFALLAVTNLILYFMKSNYTIGIGSNFVLAFYFLLMIIIKDSKLEDIFSKMLVVFLVLMTGVNIFSMIQSFILYDGGTLYVVGNTMTMFIQVCLYIYFALRIFSKENELFKSNILYYAVNILCIVSSIIGCILTVVFNGKISLLGLIVVGVFLFMHLMFVRYTYLYE